MRASFFALLASVRATTPRGRRRPAASRPTATTATSSGTPRPGCSPPCWRPSPRWRGRACSTATTGCGAARANARKTRWKGARFPWESALRGTEETPAFAKTGKLEIHVNADIALAVHQYWLATGDRRWLASRGWPILEGIARYYVSRATKRSDGTYSIRHVIPPDEYAEGVNDSVYTNMSAAKALGFASAAARTLHRAADPRWARVGRGLRILFDKAKGIHPEYAGYPGDAVKQADVTLLPYPWEHTQPRSGYPVRSRLLRAAHRPRRPVDDRRDPLDRHLAARHARVCGVHLHPTKR